MTILKPFKGLRPPGGLAEKIAARPYDVLNSDEAFEEAKGNPYSLLHITKSEIDCPPGTSEYDNLVYDKAAENLRKFISEGWLVQDEEEHLYIYAQTMHGRTQYGLVGCAAVEDYMNDRIKKHELTRKDKEADRIRHVRVTNANMEPVFFTYRAVPEIDDAVDSYAGSNKPDYDFEAADGVGHHFWVIRDKELTRRLVDLFVKVPYTYVADGHHRTAAASMAGLERKVANPHHTGKEEYNFFLAVLFPDRQLNIIDYNRVVKDLGGMETSEFLQRLEGLFEIAEKGDEVYRPTGPRNFSMYLEGRWYSLTARKGIYDDDDPVRCLDVTILSENVLDELLGIRDLRSDKRIDFVGGIRGLDELKKRVDSGDMKVAFALYPVTMKQLMDIADTGNIMPPKTTWFEPKLRSGLVVHLLD